MAKRAMSEATKKRIQAGRMLLTGKSYAEVALTVGVAHQTGTHGISYSMKAALTYRLREIIS